MAFSDIADYTTAVTGFGIAFNLDDGVDDVTIKISDNDKLGPTWQACLVSCTDLTQELRFMDPIVKVSDFSWTMQNVPLQYMQGVESHERADELFGNGFEWQGKEVTVYLLALNEVTGTIEEHAIWIGRIMECEYDEQAITFEAMARVHYLLNKECLEDTITKQDYPEVSDGVVGTAVPMLFGSCAGGYYASKLGTWNDYAERGGLRVCTDGQQYAVPCICIDTNEDGTSPGGPRFLISNHRLYSLPDPSGAYYHIYINMPRYNQMAIVAEPGDGGAEGNNSDHYADVWFYPKRAFSMYFYPYEADDENDATDPMNATDRDMDTYAVMANDEYLKLCIERPPDLGHIDKCWVAALVTEQDWETGMKTRVGIVRDDSNDNHVEWWPPGNNEEDGWTDFTSSVSAAGLKWRVHHLTGHAYLPYTENFPERMRLRMHLSDAGAATLRVHALVLVLHYAAYPFGGMRYSGSAERTTRYWEDRTRPMTPSGLGDIYDEYPDIVNAENNVYVTCQGMKDNPFGTYTGTSDALIKLPCDIVHYLIYAAGAIPNSDADYTGYVPGDIETTRADHAGFGLAHRIRVGKQTTYARLIGDICRQSFSSLTCRWSANQELGVIWWGADQTDNAYATDIEWDDVLQEREFKVSHSSVGDVRNALYFHLQYSHFVNKENQLAFCNSADSDDGEGNDDYTHKTDLADSVTQFGLWEFHMKCPYAFEREFALPVNARGKFYWVREHIARELIGTRVRVRFSLPWKYYDIQVGHILPFSIDWADHIHYPGVYTTQVGKWNLAGVRRSWVVERMSFSADGYIELEVTELRRGAD